MAQFYSYSITAFLLLFWQSERSMIAVYVLLYAPYKANQNMRKSVGKLCFILTVTGTAYFARLR